MSFPATAPQLNVNEGRLASDLAAREALDAASGKHRELMRLHMTQGVSSDGVLTLQEAQQIHRAAIRRYAVALAQVEFSAHVAFPAAHLDDETKDDPHRWKDFRLG